MSSQTQSANGRFQKTITLRTRSKGCHLITDEIVNNLQQELRNVPIGILHLFLKHTSAGLTLNENCDPDVRKDMTMTLDHVVPQTLDYRHTDEGLDDSQSHHLSSIIGVSVMIPITNGRLALGTWQGIYLTEFRELAHTRKVVATII